MQPDVFHSQVHDVRACERVRLLDRGTKCADRRVGAARDAAYRVARVDVPAVPAVLDDEYGRRRGRAEDQREDDRRQSGEARGTRHVNETGNPARFFRARGGYGSDVGLLTAPLTLARASLRLTLRAWEFGLSAAAEAAHIGMELLDPDRGARPADFARRDRPPPQDYAYNGVAPDAPPAVPDELIPDHVDEELVLVAEVAEEGAEDGAGAEVHVDPPWDGYDRMTAADIRDRLAAGTPVEAAAVELYESTHKGRRTVLDAAERALRS